MNVTVLLIIICALSFLSIVSTRLAKTWGGTQLQGALSSINYAWNNQGGFSFSRGGDQGPFVRNGSEVGSGGPRALQEVPKRALARVDPLKKGH